MARDENIPEADQSEESIGRRGGNEIDQVELRELKDENERLVPTEALRTTPEEHPACSEAVRHPILQPDHLHIVVVLVAKGEWEWTRGKEINTKDPQTRIERGQSVVSTTPTLADPLFPQQPQQD